MQNEINHFFRRKKIYDAWDKKSSYFFSNFRKYVMHARKMFNFFLFLFFKINFLKKEWKYAMQNEIDVFYSQKLKKKEYAMYVTHKMFNIF